MLDLMMSIVAWGVVGGMMGGTILIWCTIIICGPHRLGGWLGSLVRARLAAGLGRSRRTTTHSREV
jgi:hypothetical protein